MIKYIKKDLMSVDIGVIAHGCNYWGVMGAGVAKMVKQKFPTCFTEYAVWLKQFPDRKDALGKCNVINVGQGLLVANCITQGLAAVDGQLATPEAIKASLTEAFIVAHHHKLPIYLPKIGAGLGGLNWETDVEPIINELSTLYADIDTYVCIWP